MPFHRESVLLVGCLNSEIMTLCYILVVLNSNSDSSPALVSYLQPKCIPEIVFQHPFSMAIYGEYQY